MVRPGIDAKRIKGQEDHKEEATMIGAETVPLLDQGSIQFILFGLMVLVVVFLMWVTIAK
jgi:hypothetical protein